MHAVLQNETYLDNVAKYQGHLIMFRPSGNHGDEGKRGFSNGHIRVQWSAVHILLAMPCTLQEKTNSKQLTNILKVLALCFALCYRLQHNLVAFPFLSFQL